MTPRSIVCLVIAAALWLGTGAVLPAAAANGDPVNGHPNYRERAILALINACRQGPAEFRDTYLPGKRILGAGTYPPVPPLRDAPSLDHSARAHSADMERTPCFQHDSCDGTSVWDRIRRYEPGALALAENIASGYRTPLEVVVGWIDDGGARDGSDGDGHRKNLMAAVYRRVGTGSAGEGAGNTYDTQDFASGAPRVAAPLASGSHLVGDDGAITFLASYESPDGAPPAQATLEIEGRAVPMRLAFGTGRSGTWRVVLPPTGECRRYRFRFRDAGGRTWDYPEGGQLFTTGEGGCEREYEAGR